MKTILFFGGLCAALMSAADGFQPFDSGPVRGDGPALKISVNVTGVKVLRLVATCEKSPANCNIWAEPRLIAKDGTVTPLTNLKPISVKVGWGQLLLNTNWQKNPLRIADQTFTNGFWVHADSELRFKLDGQYERFEAFAGEDKDRASGIARFQVLAADPPRPMTAAELQAAELDSQFTSLERDLQQRAATRKATGERIWAGEGRVETERPGTDEIAKETFNSASLVFDNDRDPADIVLRRTTMLLTDLKSPGFDAALSKIQKLCADTPVTDKEARRRLFNDACKLRRQIAFSNPLLNFNELLFIKRHRAIYNHMCDQYYGITARPGGGLYVLKSPFSEKPEVRDVLAKSVVEKGRLKGQRLFGGNGADAQLKWDGQTWLTGDETEGGAFLSPALSYDAKHILFAYVECRGDRDQKFHTDPTRGHWDAGRAYHIFKVNVDGSRLEQLTDGTWNEFDPCWLPNDKIAFISERRGGYLRCGRACPLYNLYDMNSDGTAINLLSIHDSNEWHPSVTHDGRIVWTRWDYVDRHGCVAHVPWITRLDGTDPRALHGNFAVRQQRADMELNVRAIPGSPKYVATAAPHHGQAFGSLILIDPRVRDDDAMGPVKRITPDVGFPESQGGREVYGTPWPLSENYFLCVYDAAMMDSKARNGIGNYGIYLVDAFGNKELIYRDSLIGCLSPIPLRPTVKPPVTVNPQLVADAQPIKPGDTGEGTMAVINIYDTMRPWPAEMKAKELRIYQLLPCSVPSGGLRPHETGKRIAEAGDSVVPARWVLGTVPIEADGSAYFKVPAYRELFFQLVDERGMAIQSMRSGTAIRHGEKLVCQGCHEHKYKAATAAERVALALQRPPSEPKPDLDGSNPFSYPRLVQPVLDRNCVPCHDKNPDKAPNLKREPIANKFYASYNNLVKYSFTSYGDHYRTVPGKFGAHASKLIAMLDKGHHDVKLSPEDFHRLTLWQDTVSMFYGVFEKEPGEAQLRGEIAQGTLY
ncbi:MAG: hypothetical protein FJ395_14330 [Verrucomicrobia bacterium]|nr:hypothetical protein [Verrucomicrobiota bacterium]